MPRGQFITLEGGEGAGKSTQLARLSDAMKRCGIDHVTTREPGGSEGAEAIRALIVQGEAGRWDAVTETLLLMAARHAHVTEVISPALAEGKWVLCDRFIDSTLVYQGFSKGVDSDWLIQCHRLIFGNLMPDLTLYFDIDPAEGLTRTAARNSTEHRFESMPLSFHQRIREGFRHLAKTQPTRIRTINAAESLDKVHENVLTIINTQLGTTLASS